MHPDFVDRTTRRACLAGHKAIVSLFRTAFPDQWWQIEDLIVEGDKIVAPTTMTGTHQSDYSGIPPTGRSKHRDLPPPGRHAFGLCERR